MRSHLLRMRLGMVTPMAIVIEFYVPEKFRKQSGKWIPPEQRGKIIPFPAPEKKSASPLTTVRWLHTRTMTLLRAGLGSQEIEEFEHKPTMTAESTGLLLERTL